MIGKREVSAPFSSHLLAIAKKLKELGFLSAVTTDVKDEDSVKKTLIVTLAYDERDNAKLRGVKRISKPGRRIYVSRDQIPYVLNDLGLAILSTSRGLMTNKQARRAKIGGEIMFEIW